MIECHDECDPHMPLWISLSNRMPSSIDMHFIIMSLTPHRNKISSIRWYCLDLRAIHSTSTLSSDSGWFSMNILIRCIQSYTGSCSALSITIRSCPIISWAGSACLTEGLYNLLIMTSGRVGALEEAIHTRWLTSTSWLSNRGTYQTSNPSKNFSILRTSARYSTIFSLLQSYSFCTSFATSCESPLIRSHQMLTSLARRRPVTSPLYSAMLFVAENSSWIVYLRISPTSSCPPESKNYVSNWKCI
jgi:hypothetical protein